MEMSVPFYNGPVYTTYDCRKEAQPTLAEHRITKINVLYRNLAYKRAKRSGKLKHWKAFRTKRNAVANKLKEAKRKYFKSLNVSNPKAFWKATKFIMKKEAGYHFLNQVIARSSWMIVRRHQR